MANIYDVANAAGVSIATVSAVINDSAYVSPRLKRRVEEAIEQLGYQPNLLARGLAKKESRTLAILVPNIANPFFPDVVRGAQDKAQELGYSVLVASTDDEPEKEAEYLNVFVSKRVDGILLTKSPGKLRNELAERLRSTATPVVQLIRRIAGVKGDTVLADDRGAAFEGVAHLIRLGYRRIGVITGMSSVSTTRERLTGYRQALREAGIPVRQALIASGDYGFNSGYIAGLDLLKQAPEAVFVSNYLMAVGFIKAMQQYQLSCPRDIAIVTCDDYPWMDCFSPRLTTIDFPKYDLGAEAARVLIERVSAPDRPLQSVRLRNRLWIRDSCGMNLRNRKSALG